MDAARDSPRAYRSGQNDLPLRAILYRHVMWRAAGKTNGVWYVCSDEDGLHRIKRVAAGAGYFRPDGIGLVVELLDTIKSQAIEMREADPSAVGFRRPATDAVGHGS